MLTLKNILSEFRFKKTSKFLKFLEDIDITNPYYNSDKQIKLRSMNGDYIGKILT